MAGGTNRLLTLEQRNDELAESFKKFMAEQEAEEKRRLKSGVKFLGAMLIAVLGVLWNFRQSIIKGGF
ncbi:MAG: hypothetical protein GXP05_14750 [Alphaproteobacteria bacterium]|nr:hypothetical protein [Alphaproteobacteria bacterium]